jgi:RecB family endonuclease NucS
MRTVYHRFPTNFDLDFEISKPFGEVLRCIRTLHESHTTSKKGIDLVKCQTLVQVAHNKTTFEPVNRLPPIEDSVTEVADFRMIVRETRLTPKNRVPVSENAFLVRVADKKTFTEITIAKEESRGDMDAMDLKEILKGACA